MYFVKNNDQIKKVGLTIRTPMSAVATDNVPVRHQKKIYINETNLIMER